MLTQIAILGTGLLGTSVMQAARERGLARRITAWSRRAETRAACAGKSWCDAVFESPADCVRDADLVIVCVPVDKIVPTLADILPALRSGALVTDVGSTKEKICREADVLFRDSSAHFVGAHPMAGSEKSGSESASPALFENRICIVTPTKETPPDAFGKVAGFWHALGMRIIPSMSPTAHDEVVAHVSHLPHLLAATLAKTLRAQPESWSKCGGPGLRDTTRVAGGDPALWRAIVADNHDAISRALDAFQNEFNALRDAVKNKDFEAIQVRLAEGKIWRDALSENKI